MDVWEREQYARVRRRVGTGDHEHDAAGIEVSHLLFRQGLGDVAADYCTICHGQSCHDTGCGG